MTGPLLPFHQVPAKFRYPFFTEIHWYLLERYVSTLTGKQHRIKSSEEMRLEKEDEEDEEEEKKIKMDQAAKEEKDAGDSEELSPPG